MIRNELIDDLNKRANERPLSFNEYTELVGILIAEKQKCVIADEKYLILSIALDWAIQKRKETILHEMGVDQK